MSAVRVPRRIGKCLLLVLLATLFWLSPSDTVPPAAAAGPYLYISSEGNSRLIVSNLDGTNPTVLSFGSVTVTVPAGIALDLNNSKMYITDDSSYHLIQSNLDGSNASDLGNPGGLLLVASGIAIDHQNQYPYIASVFNHARIGL